MSVLGFLLIFLALPLFIIYSLQPSEKRNAGQRNIGLLLAGVGLIVILLGAGQ